MFYLDEYDDGCTEILEWLPGFRGAGCVSRQPIHYACPGGSIRPLRISGDGYYNITKADENGFTDLVAWTESSAVRQGTKTNKIVASCIGNTLKLEVNGEVVAQATDSTYSSGDIALMAVVYEDGSTTKVQFDNLVVRKP